MGNNSPVRRAASGSGRLLAGALAVGLALPFFMAYATEYAIRKQATISEPSVAPVAPLQPTTAAPSRTAFDPGTFTLGYVEFEWGPGQIPGFDWTQPAADDPASLALAQVP